MTDQPKAPRAEPQKQAQPSFANIDQTVRVIDSTAVNVSRTHDMIVDGVQTPFTFEPGKPLEMPTAIAAKFLRFPEFKQIDAAGKIVPYQRTPKQPAELEAGEVLVLLDEETIARYDELSPAALHKRVLEQVGGEKVPSNREEMIAFLVRTAARKRTQNVVANDAGSDEFTPAEDEAA